MSDKVSFLKNEKVWVVVYDHASARCLFAEKRWECKVNDKIYTPGDWRGREAIDNLFKKYEYIKID